MTHPDAGKRFTDADLFTALRIAEIELHEQLVADGQLPVDEDIVKARGFLLLALHSRLIEAGAVAPGAVSARLRTVCANPETDGQGIVLRYFADMLDRGWPKPALVRDDG